MPLSARNQLSGTVKSVKLGEVAAEVVADVGGTDLVAEITRASAEKLGLAEGTRVTLIIKASDVIVATE
ncbi:MAG: TOBE domain-containing protein [Actinomycetota bacterium]